MCYPAKEGQAQAFADDLVKRLPREVASTRVERTGRENPWFPGTDVEVVVVAAGDPEELRPKVAQIVTETMWRDDIWVEVRVVEASAAGDGSRSERVALRA
jgi:hypothetical protein